jgi:hypothetical protein
MNAFAHNILADLIRDQEIDAMDRPFSYSEINTPMDAPIGAWVTPTAFMVVALKEMLRALVRMYGVDGCALLRDIGIRNTSDMGFIDDLGLEMFCKIYDRGIAAFPEGEAKRLGFVG